METVLPWIGALVVGVVSWRVASRRKAREHRESVAALARDLRSGKVAPSREAALREPSGLRELRHAVAEAWKPRSAGEPKDTQGLALARFAEFLRNAVADPLLRALETGDRGLRDGVERVLDSVEDTEFFLEEPEAQFQLGSVTAVLQEVSRELTREMNTTVRLAAPDRPVRARLAPEALKDALYLILANAAHFSRGGRVDLIMEEEGGRCRILIRDTGPGFSEEALERATEPFFTTERGALGLGLGQAERIVEMHAGELRLQNRNGEGAEVEIVLPTKS